MPVPVSAPAWARPYAPADIRADASIALVAQSAIGFAILALQAAFGPPVSLPARDPAAIAALAALVGGTLLAYVGLLGAAIAVPAWSSKCYRNLPALGSRGHMSPAWAAAGWFVPIANLVLPFVAVLDVLVASMTGRPWSAALAAWWVTWLAAWAVRFGGGFLTWGGQAEVLSAGLMAVSGVLFVLIVQVIRLGQRRQAAAHR